MQDFNQVLKIEKEILATAKSSNFHEYEFKIQKGICMTLI